MIKRKIKRFFLVCIFLVLILIFGEIINTQVKIFKTESGKRAALAIRDNIDKFKKKYNCYPWRYKNNSCNTAKIFTQQPIIIGDEYPLWLVGNESSLFERSFLERNVGGKETLKNIYLIDENATSYSLCYRNFNRQPGLTSYAPGAKAFYCVVYDNQGNIPVDGEFYR